MADNWQEAGPEWAYLAPLTQKQSLALDLDSLCINLRREGDQPVTKIDSLQALRTSQGMYVPSDVTRFSYGKLREMIGSNSDEFDLFFVAYEDAEPGVAIPDASSFRRLLSAILYLGFPVSQPGSQRSDPPPVLRFFARPKDDLEAVAVETYHRSPGIRRAGPYSPYTRGQRIRTHPDFTEPDDEPESIPRPPTPRRQRVSILRLEETSGPRNIPIRHGDTPAPKEPFETPPSQRGLQLGGGRRSSLMSLDTFEGHSEGRDSFLEAPKEPQREPLTFDERVRVEEDLDYGLSIHNEDPHLQHVHDLYCDIAGHPREKCDPENPDHEYHPPYSTVSLPASQFYPTGWILSQPEKLLYYLADKPGLGKTFAAIETSLRISLILSNGIDINRERAHLPFLQTRPLHMHDKPHPQFGKNSTCRAKTLERYGFLCQCDKNSPTYKVMQDEPFSPGYILIVVPLGLVNQWVQEIRRFIRSNATLPHSKKHFEIINVHEGRDYGENLKNAIMAKREHFGLGTFVIVPTTSTVTKSLENLRENISKRPETLPGSQPSLIVMDEIQNIASTTHDAVEWVRLLINRAHMPVHVLCLGGSPWKNGPADFDVVEKLALDRHSWSGWWTEEAYDDYEQRLKNARANLNESAKQVRQMDIIGRGKQGGVQDEEKAAAHEVLMWHDQKLQEYAAQIPLLRRKDGTMYLGYYIPKSSGTAEIQRIRCDSELTNAQKLVAGTYKEFLRVCHRKRVRDWNRKPESTRGPRPKIKELIFNLDSVGTSSSVTEVSLVGFAPGLTQLVRSDKSGGVQFRSDEANRVFRRTTTKTQREAARNSKFWDLAQTAFDKVDTHTGQTVLYPKVQFICNIIDDMLRDREPHVKDSQTLGVFEKKMIIVTPHAYQSVLLTAFLMQRYPHYNFTFVGALNEPNQERPALLAPFSRTTTVKSPEDGRGHDPIALISTYGIIGTGLNLTRCNYLIVTSPLSSKAFETQQFGRIDRKGQFASQLYCYVLIDNGNPVDVTTFHRMQKRTALTVPPDEIGSGLDFLLEDIDEEDERAPDSDDEMGQ